MSAVGDHALRNVYSANVRNDPAVLAAQLRVVRALERACRGAGARCAEASAARRYIDEHASR